MIFLLNRKNFEIYNNVTLFLVALVLVLMILKVIPYGWFVPILAATVVLFLIRIILRIYFYLQDKKKK